MHPVKVIFLIAMLASFNAWAQPEDLRVKHFNLKDNLAIGGYDPVAYFISDKAVKGKKDLTWPHAGVTYCFASVSNRDFFKRNPAQYEPQYGGWCAYAMGRSGEKVQVDPETFRILDGRLYLFYNRFFNNTLDSWRRDEKALKNQADKNWVKIYR